MGTDFQFKILLLIKTLLAFISVHSRLIKTAFLDSKNTSHDCARFRPDYPIAMPGAYAPFGIRIVNLRTKPVLESTHQDETVLTARKPRLLNVNDGVYQSRNADRQNLASLLQLPPRLTRLEPEPGPTQSVTVPVG